MRECIHGRTERQKCRACDEYQEADPDTQRRLERCQTEPVTIVHTDETGEWVYAVSMADAYWLDAFKTMRQAEEFCKRHRLNRIEVQP